MEDKGLEIIQKRRNLKNLLDQATAKQKDLNHLNEMIEKDTRDLQLLEMMLKVDRAMDDLNNYPKEFIDGLKTWSRKRLNVLYSDMSGEEIDMLYERIRIL